MNEQEAFKLLTLASARDNRTVSESVAKVWALDLEWVSFSDGVEALTLHYRETENKWLEPGHVVAGARRAKDARERELRRQRPAIVSVPSTHDAAQHRKEFEESLAEHRRSKGVSDV
jgi:hypothetical protein